MRKMLTMDRGLLIGNGTVAALVCARDEEHVMEIANESDGALARSMFVRDAGIGPIVARRLHRETARLNGLPATDVARMPVGDVGPSGYGRSGETATIDEFTERCRLEVEDPDRHDPN